MVTVRIASTLPALMLIVACGGGGGESASVSSSAPPVQTFLVTAFAGTGGTISPASTNVSRGGSASFTVTANPGYAVEGVSGCEGSLSGNIYSTGAVNAACTVNASFRVAELFTAVPILTPDLYPKFKSLCDPESKGLPASVYNINGYTVANISGHKDGKRDIVVGLWCQPQIGSVVNELTRSGIVVFLQNPDGTFTDATNQLFGVEVLDAAGGVPFRMISQDLNGDGYDEVFIAVTGEDGRTLPPGFTGYNRQSIALTSTSTGAYKSIKLGSPSYNYLAKFVVSPSGSTDVLTDTIGYGGRKHAFRLSGDQWSETNEYQDVPNYGYAFSSSGGSRASVDIAIGEAATSTSRDIVLYKRSDVSSAWSLVDRKSLGSVQTAEIKTWNGDRGDIYIYRFDGIDYAFVQFADNCEVQGTSGSLYSLFAVSAQKIIGGHRPGRTYTEGDPTDFELSLLMFGYGVTNNFIVEKKPSVQNLLTKRFYTLTCDDLTGDGQSDLFISNWGTGEKPDIYVSQSSGDFALVDPLKIPAASHQFDGAHAIYQDLDGDGIKDMLYVVRAPNANAVSLRLQVFRGLRGVASADIL